MAFGTFAFKAQAKPAQVSVGAYINDIHNIDLRTHSFQADVYIWLKWTAADFDPATSLEVMNPFELWALDRTASYDSAITLPDGSFYQVIRMQGSFAEKFDLANYPFDPQYLHIDLEDNRMNDSGINYVIDPEGVSINPKVTLPGYTIGKPRLEVRQTAYPTTFGDPRPEAQNRIYSRIHIGMPIQRPMVPNAFKLLIPVICVVFCASLMFLFNPSYVDSRVGIGITALLTVVALQITLNEDLPEIDYIVLIDKVYLATYLYVIAGLAIVVKTTWMLESAVSDAAKAIRLDQICLVLLTAIYGCVVFAIIGYALLGIAT